MSLDAPGDPAGMVEPRYGSTAISDLLGSVAAALGVPGFVDRVGLPEMQRAVLLLIDGLGWHQLAATADGAGYLSELSRRASARLLTAAVPSTTATSLTSLGTGLPPGQHGVVGYTHRVPDTGRLLNALRWDPQVDPRRWQPYPTVFDAVARVGVAARDVNQSKFAGSGLSIAAFRGAPHRAADTVAEKLDAVRFASRESDRSLTYVYSCEVDHAGHVFGCDSPQWRDALAAADGLARDLRAVLPREAVLLVTGDHGMVDVGFGPMRVDIQTEIGLADGVDLVGGEPRLRHLYCPASQVAAVVARFADRLGRHAIVLARAEAIGRGWFGRVDDQVADRIGDVVVAALDQHVLLATKTFPHEPKLIGMHGSLTAAEMEIPLLVDVG